MTPDERRAYQRQWCAVNPDKVRKYHEAKSPKAKEYSRRSYEKHRAEVLERGRKRTESGANREAWNRKMAVPENRERERARNRARMRLKREPARLAREIARKEQAKLAELARAKMLELQRNRPTSAELLKARKHRYHLRHREKVCSASHVWRIANPERFLARIRSWHKAHPEQARIGVKRWRAKHPEKNREFAANRRARKAKSFIEPVDPSVVFSRANGICGICRKTINSSDNWHVDHVIPLARGGAHSYDNTQAAHAFCNISKGAKIPPGQLGLFQRVA